MFFDFWYNASVAEIKLPGYEGLVTSSLSEGNREAIEKSVREQGFEVLSAGERKDLNEGEFVMVVYDDMKGVQVVAGGQQEGWYVFSPVNSIMGMPSYWRSTRLEGRLGCKICVMTSIGKIAETPLDDKVTAPSDSMKSRNSGIGEERIVLQIKGKNFGLDVLMVACKETEEKKEGV